MNKSRVELFAEWLRDDASRGRAQLVGPISAGEDDLLLFHTPEYIKLVKDSSKLGEGLLDAGDTPSFKGVYEASLFAVGNTLNGLDLVIDGKFDHFFNPVGGLHHAREGAAEGFCVFNDCSIAIASALSRKGLSRVAYVDIDAHHGDGVFYGFESDSRVFVGDIHEDGRFLFPGSGSAGEKGQKGAEGTKLNVPIPPGSGDAEFISAFDEVVDLIRRSRPQLILFQCGADGLIGDPLTHLEYTAAAHTHASRVLHELAHEFCGGRILAMGGGGYDAVNVSSAWSAVVKEFSRHER